MDHFHTRTHNLKGTISPHIQQNIKYTTKSCKTATIWYKNNSNRNRSQNQHIYCIHGRLSKYRNASGIRHQTVASGFFSAGKNSNQPICDRIRRLEMDQYNGRCYDSGFIWKYGFISGWRSKGYLISSKSFPTRGVQNADQEVAIVGPKDSFTESLRMNTALIRRRIRDTRLKVIQKQIGTRSKTDYALMYIEDLVQKDILNKIQKQMDKICVDGIFDNGMLQQYLEKDSKTPFPLYQLTQRPDKVASSIMEGRIAVVLDNSPMVLLLPVTFNVFFQASDDYYNRWEITTFVRILRYVAAIISIGLPGFYVAIAGFHPEVLPTPFLLALISAREGVPFPVIVEVLLMELSFELLREAGIRLPGQLGGTMGVVGGLIVGQAAVDAHLVSTIVVIVVALTAIATFSIPNELFTSAFRLMKFFLIILCAFWGLYGFFLGFLAIFIHLFYLENYGVPYAHPMVEERGRLSTAFQDFMVRYPLKWMKYRPEFTKEGARVRQKEDEDEK